MTDTDPENSVAELDVDDTPPAAQPDAWKLVPVKPTPEMVDAGQNDLRLRGYDRALIVSAVECYGAMLAVAPAPQRQWFGLTDEEISRQVFGVTEGAFFNAFNQGAKWAEAKLKEKNT